MTEEIAPQTQIQREWKMLRKAYEQGYSDGLRSGLAQGSNHPAVIESVKRIFGNWEGIQAARQRSKERFWKEYREDEAA